MAGFYSNLLTKNIAMGGDINAAVSAYTAGSGRNALLESGEDSKPPLNGSKAFQEASVHKKVEVLITEEKRDIKAGSPISTEMKVGVSECPTVEPVLMEETVAKVTVLNVLSTYSSLLRFLFFRRRRSEVLYCLLKKDMKCGRSKKRPA